MIAGDTTAWLLSTHLENRMSSTVQPSLNGRAKKTLAFQLDRLDTILDGLADALNGAVSDAVRETVGVAAKEAVRVALDEALSQPKHISCQQKPNAFKRLWLWMKHATGTMICKIRETVQTAYQTVRQRGSRLLSATALALQSCITGVKSRTMRIGIILGAGVSCVLSLFRNDAKFIWWSAGMVVGSMLLESYFGTLGTLIMGGSLLYLTLQPSSRAVNQPAMHET